MIDSDVDRRLQSILERTIAVENFRGDERKKKNQKKETPRPDGNDASEEIRQKARIPSEAWKSFAKNAQLSHIPTGPTAIDTQELNFSEILFAELDAHN
jgi:hypothetical protein